MRPPRQSNLIALATLLLAGCAGSPQTEQKQEEFFKPIPRKIKPSVSIAESPAANTDRALDSLVMQQKEQEALLTRWKETAKTLERANRQLTSKVEELQARLFVSQNYKSDSAKRLDEHALDSLYKENGELRQSLTQMEVAVSRLQRENRGLTTKVTTLEADLLGYKTNPAKQEDPGVDPEFARAKNNTALINDYASAMDLYNQKRFPEAIRGFERLLDQGIEEELADNCQHWIGESYYALGDYEKAINAFNKVVGITSASKRPDALYMLGRTYEDVGDISKARFNFQKLFKEYPKHKLAAVARQKLQSSKFQLPKPQKKAPKTRSKSKAS
ncbi:MAG: tetratricopeptide repeat protein [Bacteroidota bacterium]